MAELTAVPMVHRVFTSAAIGDLGPSAAPDELASRRADISPYPWTWLHQVHGNEVVVVEAPGQHAGASADAAVTAVRGAVLSVRTADCAGVLLVGAAHARQTSSPPIQIIGAAHAGWRGLETEILQRTVDAMRSLGAEEIRWRMGPCISADAYEFGVGDLDRLAGRYGDELRGTTAWGAPALDLRAGVRAALAEAGAVEMDGNEPPCTASDGRYYSFRARGDVGRQVAAIWMDPS